MARRQASVVVDRSAPEVWAFVTDLAATPRWRTTLTAVEPPAALAEGARFHATSRVLGRTWRWVVAIDAVEPERRLAYRVVDGFADIRTEYRLEPLADGCRFTMVGESRSRRLVERLLEPLAARVLGREMRRHLGNLQRLLAR